MATNRLASGALTFILLALLAWLAITGFGDVRTMLILGFGSVLGLLYTTMGLLPAWIVNNSGGSITSDDDPSNISPRIYLPILFGVIVLATIVFVAAFQFL